MTVISGSSRVPALTTLTKIKKYGVLTACFPMKAQPVIEAFALRL